MTCRVLLCPTGGTLIYPLIKYLESALHAHRQTIGIETNVTMGVHAIGMMVHVVQRRLIYI